MFKSRQLTRRDVGFTLIELLVVISIISLLIAILLPALAGARKSAQMTKCMVNMRQIGIALTTYMQDFEQQFPNNYFYRSNGTTFVDGQDVAYVGKVGSQTPWHSPAFHSLNRYLVASVDHTTDTPFAHCPSDDTDASQIGGYAYNGSSYMSNTNIHYLRNAKLAEGAHTDKPNHQRGIREGDIKTPHGKFPTLMETGAKYVYNGNTIGLRPWLRFHSASGDDNIFMTVFADGHAGLITYGASVYFGEDYNLARD